MTSFNHITLNSGNKKIVSSNHIDKDMFFILSRIIREAKSHDEYMMDERENEPKTKIKISTLEDKNAYMISTWCYHEKANTWLCVLTTVCCLKDTQGFWWQLHEYSNQKFKTKAKRPPSAPWIADRIEEDAVAAFGYKITSVFLWTADMTRTLSIMLLASKEVLWD